VLRIGVLALQGDFAAHAHALLGLGVEVEEVRRVAALDRIDGLVMPGGESTTLLNLMGDEPWFDGLRAFHARGGALFGTCAGAILLSREVRGPAQPSLGLLDATIRRNGYGRQVDSFETDLDVKELAGGPFHAVFIRAPLVTDVGPDATVLAEHDGAPVLVAQGRILVAAFHPELSDDPRLHQRFLQEV
jgi:5'-phosphate synthase pdxT subunit